MTGQICGICGANPDFRKFRFSKDDYDFLKCSRNDAEPIAPLPDYSILEKHYREREKTGGNYDFRNSHLGKRVGRLKNLALKFSLSQLPWPKKHQGRIVGVRLEELGSRQTFDMLLARQDES